MTTFEGKFIGKNVKLLSSLHVLTNLSPQNYWVEQWTV